MLNKELPLVLSQRRTKRRTRATTRKELLSQRPPPNKKKPSKAFQTVRSKKNKQTGYLPRITSDGEAPLPQALLKKLDDVVQNDTPIIVIKDSPTNIDSTGNCSPVEETSGSSGTTTPTAPTPGQKPRKLKKKQPVKFSLDNSLVSVLKALEAPFIYKEQDQEEQQQEEPDQDEDEAYLPLLLRLTMEQSVESASSSSSSPSFAASSPSPVMVPRKRTNKPREQKRQFPGNNNLLQAD